MFVVMQMALITAQSFNNFFPSIVGTLGYDVSRPISLRSNRDFSKPTSRVGADMSQPPLQISEEACYTSLALGERTPVNIILTAHQNSPPDSTALLLCLHCVTFSILSCGSQARAGLSHRCPNVLRATGKLASHVRKVHWRPVLLHVLDDQWDLQSV